MTDKDNYKAAMQRIHEFDRCIRKIATALGSPACGGVDTTIDDPLGTAGVLVAWIDGLKQRIAELQADVDGDDDRFLGYEAQVLALGKKLAEQKLINANLDQIHAETELISRRRLQLAEGQVEELTKLLAAEQRGFDSGRVGMFSALDVAKAQDLSFGEGKQAGRDEFTPIAWMSPEECDEHGVSSPCVHVQEVGEHRNSFCGKCGHPLPVIEMLLAEIAQLKSGCTRSHPHELMTPMCELRTDIARLTNHLAVCQSELSTTRDKMAMLVDCAEDLLVKINSNITIAESEKSEQAMRDALSATSSEVAKHRAECDAKVLEDAADRLGDTYTGYPSQEEFQCFTSTFDCIEELRRIANELRASANQQKG